MPYGIDNLILIDEDTRRRVYETGQIGGGGVNTAKKPWAVGELEFEALMRMLDNAVSEKWGLLTFILWPVNKNVKYNTFLFPRASELGSVTRRPWCGWSQPGPTMWSFHRQSPTWAI